MKLRICLIGLVTKYLLSLAKSGFMVIMSPRTAQRRRISSIMIAISIKKYSLTMGINVFIVL